MGPPRSYSIEPPPSRIRPGRSSVAGLDGGGGMMETFLGRVLRRCRARERRKGAAGHGAGEAMVPSRWDLVACSPLSLDPSTTLSDLVEGKVGGRREAADR